MAPEGKKEIVIVGGSLTALMTGIPLVRLGHNVTILERLRSSLLESQGAGIASHPIIPPIIASLKALGTSGSPTIDFYRKYDRTGVPWTNPRVGNFKYLKSDGSVKFESEPWKLIGLTEEEGKKVSGGSSWDLLYHTLRANFDGWEGSYVAAAKKEENEGDSVYLDGVKVVGLKDLGEKVEVEVEGRDNFIADFVVAADGPSSLMRRLLDPESERTYAGYVAWRGTVKETELSPETRALLGDNPVLFHRKATQVLTYRIPGLNGTIKDDEMLMNIVWYANVPPADLPRILTDSSGHTHNFSLGVGKIDPVVRETQAELSKTLPPPLYELYSKVPSPFIQAVTDHLATQAVFFDGKVVLAGDALAGFRPHTTVGTGQGALHALLLTKVFEGELTLKEWATTVLGFARQTSEIGKKLGMLSQYGKHPMADDGEA